MSKVKQSCRSTAGISATALVLLLTLQRCSKGAQKPSSEIIERNIGGRNFYTPKAYINMPYTSVGNNGALLQAWYAGGAIVSGNPHDLWKQKQWYQNVKLLIDWYIVILNLWPTATDYCVN